MNGRTESPINENLAFSKLIITLQLIDIGKIFSYN